MAIKQLSIFVENREGTLVTVTDAIAKLRVVYPNLMKLSYDNKRTQGQQELGDAQEIEKKSPLELFEEFYEKQNNQKMTDEQREVVVEYIASIWEG